MGPTKMAVSQGISLRAQQVFHQELLLEVLEPGLWGGGWWKIAGTLQALSAPALRHNEIY